MWLITFLFIACVSVYFIALLCPCLTYNLTSVLKTICLFVLSYFFFFLFSSHLCGITILLCSLLPVLPTFIVSCVPVHAGCRRRVQKVLLLQKPQNIQAHPQPTSIHGSHPWWTTPGLFTLTALMRLKVLGVLKRILYVERARNCCWV